MQDSLSENERKLLAVLHEGLPQSQTPYKDLAEKIGITTEEVLQILKNWKQQGKLRRIGAVVNHFKVGLSAGAMVVWKVAPVRIEQVAQIMAGFKEVSHLYERETNEYWPYNIYSMIHGQTRQDLNQTILDMSKKCGVSDYRILTTERELKKTPPEYKI